jgi:hypothetical protein
LSVDYEYYQKGKVVARSYLYQTAVPSAETEVTYSPKEGKIRKAGYGHKSSTQVTLLPHGSHKHAEDEAKNVESVGSFNLKYGDRGTFHGDGKENGNNNNGNGINFGSKMYAKQPMSPAASPVLSKTPLPVIGGKS